MTIHYVRPDGTYVGGYGDGASPTAEDAAPAKVSKLVCLDEEYPEYADQIWQFPGWTPSRMKLSSIENNWRNAEIQIISNQLMAIEEAEAGSDGAEPLPGTRTEWLMYRTKVRAWKDGNDDFPDQAKRPVMPS